MKPQNFKKLHGKQITRVDGSGLTDFVLEVSGTGSGDSVWIFDKGADKTFRAHGDQNGYCTFMYIDWELKQYSLKRCRLGEGTRGEDLVTKCKLPIERCKSMEEFMRFVMEVVDEQIRLGVYNK